MDSGIRRLLRKPIKAAASKLIGCRLRYGEFQGFLVKNGRKASYRKSWVVAVLNWPYPKGSTDADVAGLSAPWAESGIVGW